MLTWPARLRAGRLRSALRGAARGEHELSEHGAEVSNRWPTSAGWWSG